MGKLAYVTYKGGAIEYSWLLMKFIYAPVVCTNFDKEEMLQSEGTRTSHGLSKKGSADRVIICPSLLAQSNIEHFVKRMTTMNQKYVTYENIVRKKASWNSEQHYIKIHGDAQWEGYPYCLMIMLGDMLRWRLFEIVKACEIL
ncbi:hypothetical protein DICVIV_04848 [Dictyocaulus viviparus]|uniref:Uncharacterized protein n=1 Tax=Dictyocaulus viviparus TaxID=29172 RepID=A0A0D8XWX1_DICVI|nr:hypothetical protein DICVIV_04848 [Dictyocaulus viviparus]